MIKWYDKPIEKFIKDVKANDVVRAEYGHSDNWINMIIADVSLENIIALRNPRVCAKYRANIKTKFFLEEHGKVSDKIEEGFNSIYFSTVEELIYQIHGEWKEN